MLNKIYPSLLSFNVQLQNQLQANQRLRWMLWGIAYILVVYFALTLSELRQADNETIAQLQRTSNKLDQLQHQTQWPERLQHEQELGVQLRSRLWETQSESLAEADVQNYLRRLMTDHNALNYRPRLAPTEKIEIAGQSLIKVTAEVSGSLAVGQVNHLLKALADSPRFIAVERFGYAAQRAGQLDMMVTAYFLIVDSAAPAPQGGSDAAR